MQGDYTTILQDLLFRLDQQVNQAVGNFGIPQPVLRKLGAYLCTMSTIVAIRLLTCYRMLIILMYSRHISTNDINYPILWNALSKEDKARLFHKRKTDCCMDHFLETVNCRIIDHCSSDT